MGELPPGIDIDNLDDLLSTLSPSVMEALGIKMDDSGERISLDGTACGCVRGCVRGCDRAYNMWWWSKSWSRS